MIDIVMVTYNQEKFIEAAIKSVLDQNTKVKYKLIIGDDASTDKTAQICEFYAIKYPEIIILLKHDRNKGIIENYKQCFEKCSSEYICILEGDDFWTDSMKLDNQFYLMSSSDDIGLVHSDYMTYNENKKTLKHNPKKIKRFCANNQGFVFNELLLNNFICPLTVMFKRSYIENIDYNFLLDNQIKTIDYYLWLKISLSSKIIYENHATGVYRVSDFSISNNFDIKKRIEFEETKIKIVSYFTEKYCENNHNLKSFEKRSHAYLFFKALKKKELKYIIHYLKKVSIKGVFEFIKIQLKFYI